MKPTQLQTRADGAESLSRKRLVQHRLITLAGLALGWLLPLHGACGSSVAPDTELLKLKRAVITNYTAVVSATYEDSLAAVKNLASAVKAFLDEPSEKSLSAAREAWREARVPYCQTEVCRFYDGPIDQVEGMVNAWPIDENYIDYVADDPNAGVINAVSNFPALSRELIVSLNEKEGKKNISTGFHAVEFLLWGQDLNPAGPGNRPWRDYTAGANHGDRRRQYLRIVTELLVEHLETVTAAWANGSSPNEGRADLQVVHHPVTANGSSPNYRSEFLALDSDVALANILKGMGALSGPELAGERLTVPYETKEQEDEQSCFSDNTRNDLIYDAVGIQNVYLGRYVKRSCRKGEGPGVHDLLMSLDPDLANKLAAQIETTVACTRNIPQPFDQAILGTSTSPGRVAVKQAATASQTQSDTIAKAAKALSVKLNL